MARGRANLRPAPPFEPGNDAALTHGAHSERQIVPRAASQKRRFLRQIGLRQADLDGIGVALLDNWARAQAKVEILDRYFAENGLLDGRGRPRAAAALYFTALSSARLAATRLADHLRAAEPRGPTLAAYLAEKYGDDG